MRALITTVTTVIYSTLIIGCAASSSGGSYGIWVNSVVSPDRPAFINPNSTVHIYTDPEEPDLFRREVAYKIKYLLQEKGHVAVPIDEADLIVYFGYAIDSKTVTETQTNYVYNPSTASSSTSKPAATGSAAGDFAVGFAQGLSSAMKNYTPQQQLRQTKVNDRFLMISVVDGRQLRTAGKTLKVWQCETLSSGKHSDIRHILNYMLIPTIDNFGNDTGKAVWYKLRQRNSRVQKLRQATRP